MNHGRLKELDRRSNRSFGLRSHRLDVAPNVRHGDYGRESIRCVRGTHRLDSPPRRGRGLGLDDLLGGRTRSRFVLTWALE